MLSIRLSRERAALLLYPGRNSTMGVYATSSKTTAKIKNTKAVIAAKTPAGEISICHSSLCASTPCMLNRRLRITLLHLEDFDLIHFIITLYSTKILKFSEKPRKRPKLASLTTKKEGLLQLESCPAPVKGCPKWLYCQSSTSPSSSISIFS